MKVFISSGSRLDADGKRFTMNVIAVRHAIKELLEESNMAQVYVRELRNCWDSADQENAAPCVSKIFAFSLLITKMTKKSTPKGLLMNMKRQKARQENDVRSMSFKANTQIEGNEKYIYLTYLFLC